MSEASRARGAGLALNRRLAERGHRTKCERQVEEWLVERGVEYEAQVPVGEHVVDFYLPATGEIIEADGAYWHQEQRKDIERDRALLDAAPGVEITHLHFFQKRFTPPIDPEPLAGVRYVVCNPSPHSFIDTRTFVPKAILSRREWRYGDEPPAKKGHWGAQVYDLAIEGVSSFVASGLVVHNSHVEYGTRAHPIDAQTGHYLRFVSKGAIRFAKHVDHPGTTGQFMFLRGSRIAEAKWKQSARGRLNTFLVRFR
jgi:hypothetical protein